MNEQISEFTPNISQELALKALESHKKNKALIVLPSGSGKTYLAAFHSQVRKASKILYVAHRREILEQARQIFTNVHNIGENKMGFVDANSKDFSKDVIFATIQTASNKKNLKIIKEMKFDYVVIDEFHHGCSSSYRKLLKIIKTEFLLGITATAYRLDGQSVEELVDMNVPFEMGLKEGMEQKILVPFVYFGLWDNIDYSDIEWQGHHYREKDLNRKLVIKKRDLAILKQYKEYCLGRRPCMAFCVNLKHAVRITKLFNQNGVKAVCMTHKTRYERRKYMTEAFRDGAYDIMFTVDIFNEGVDFPEVKALMFLRPTFSKNVFMQQLGRGLRKAKDKNDVLVLDFVANYKNSWARQHWLQGLGFGKEIIGKPVYQYSDVPQVFFEQKVIDLFLEEQRKSAPISKQGLIQNWETVKEKLGRQPTAHELQRLGVHDMRTYKKYFGTWDNFLQEVGGIILPSNRWSDTVRKKKQPTKKELVKNYKDVKEKLGRQPKSDSDMGYQKTSKYNIRKYQEKFGSWNAFLRKIGEPILRHRAKKKVKK